jgi:hypothetical protein
MRSTESRVRIGARAALLFAVAALAAGCPAPGYHPGQKSETRRVLVFPLNVVAAMPRELIGGSRHVDQVMLDYLAERGMAVDTIGFADAQAAWHQGESDCRAEKKKGCDRFDGVAPFVARHQRAEHGYDMLLVPYLLLRGARTNGVVARFDGVERPLETTGYASGYAPDYPYPLFNAGRVRAASLRVFGFSPDGKKRFTGIGGLDVVDRIDASEQPGAYSIEARANVLGDPQQIREGVAIALRELLPRQRS